MLNLIDETIREGASRGFHPKTVDERVALIALIHEITGIKDFAIGFAATDRAARDVAGFLTAVEEGKLSADCVCYLHGIPQGHAKTVALLQSLPVGRRSHVAVNVPVAASDIIARPLDGAWLMSELGRSAEDRLTMGTTEFHEATAALASRHARELTALAPAHVALLLLDAFRAELDVVEIYFRAAIDVGMTNIRLHDTIGIATPELVVDRISHLHRRFPTLSIHVHFHDDFGLAAANTLSAIKAGAGGADVTINGVGNRAGNAPTQVVLTALHLLEGVDFPGVRFERLNELSRAAEKYFCLLQSPFAPVTGRLVHVDEASIRTHLINTDNQQIFLPYSPTFVGARLEAVHTEASRRIAVKDSLALAAEEIGRHGLHLDDALVDRAHDWTSREVDRRAATHRATILDTMELYERSLRSSYVTDADIVSSIVPQGTD